MNHKLLNLHHFSASIAMKILVLPVLLLLSLVGFTQSYGEIGLFGGGSYYIGDLNSAKQFQITKPAFGAFVRHNFNERIAFKLAGTYGAIGGDDALSKADLTRNLNFSSSIIDISTTFEINFFEYFIGSLKYYVTPYMFGGAGVVLFNPKGKYDGNLYELQPLGTEGQGSDAYPDRKPYSKVAFTIPFGIGVKYSLNDFVGLSLYWSMQKTYTDYLDDVSTTYYLDLAGDDPATTDIAGLLSDPTLLHNSDMQRGNSETNDWYSFAGLSVSLKINYASRHKCLNVFL